MTEAYQGPMPHHEWVLTRLLRLSREACPRLRAGFPPGPSRWYVDSGPVTVTGPSGGGFCPWGNGATPEEALRAVWEFILQNLASPERFLLIYSCPPNVPIPGDGPQVWVRWNAERDDWEDVPPTPEMLKAWGIPPDRIRSYREHRCLQRR